MAGMTAPTVRVFDSLPPEIAGAALILVEQAAAADGFSALNEAASLRLRHPHPDTTHLLGYRGEALVGYGQLHVATGALVVHPEHRRLGAGTVILRAMIELSGRRLEIWATRHTPGARALARRAGLDPVRQLLIMTRPLSEPIDVPELPAGLAIRAFEPGRDESAWLGVNARAFATHPEQGSLTAADLDERMREPWFDPAGFLVAIERDKPARMVGFHWTKQHADGLGEVYVLGVDPGAGVRGLGRALLAAGLAHLRAVGNTLVQLYVDAENVRAVALYERAGFAVASSDVMYASPNAEVEPLATMQVSSDA